MGQFINEEFHNLPTAWQWDFRSVHSSGPGSSDHPLTLTSFFGVLVFFFLAPHNKTTGGHRTFFVAPGVVVVEILSVTNRPLTRRSFRMQASEVALELARGPSARKLLMGISRSGSESFGCHRHCAQAKIYPQKGMAFRKGSNNFMRIS